MGNCDWTYMGRRNYRGNLLCMGPLYILCINQPYPVLVKTMSNQKYFTFNVTITATIVVKADDEEQANMQVTDALNHLDIDDACYTHHVVEQFDCGVEEITLVQTDPINS